MKVKCKSKRCMESNGGKPYEWEYKGDNPFYAPCPRCKTSVKVEANSPEEARGKLISGEGFGVPTVEAASCDSATIHPPIKEEAIAKTTGSKVKHG